MTEKPPPPSTLTADPTPHTPVVGELVRKPPYVGRLKRVRDWNGQLGKIFREMRQGTLPLEDGTKLAYVANLGLQWARTEEELREAEALREELKRLRPMMNTSGVVLEYSGEGS